MARKARSQQMEINEQAAAQAVPDPIINSPYDEPTHHWTYIKGEPRKQLGRRPASYFYTTRKVGSRQQAMFAEEQFDELWLVNLIRQDVKRWRKSEYRGASPVTRDLFRWWFADERPRRLFFCQREAIETLVYLLELAIPRQLARTKYKKFALDPGAIEKLLEGIRLERETGIGGDSEDNWPRLVDLPADPSLLPLRRLGCKMATGSGKTLVMAMLITWAFCNRARNPHSTQFPNAVLVCAPNLTVKKRLAVLKPGDPHNYYDAFDLVPAKYRELLGQGRVLVTNWHAFSPKSEHQEGGTSYTVVQKGKETDDAFTKDRLGDLARRLPILVLNDEGHHCWRPKNDQILQISGVSPEERAALASEAEEARVWLQGLDRINNSGLLGAGKPGVLATVDLSATPFYLANSGYPQGSPFPWLVSDFGLVDAIEAGIVKVPRLPVKDDTTTKDDAGRPDPKYFALWRHITASLNKKVDFHRNQPKPEAVYREVESALQTLADQWKTKFDAIIAANPGATPIPPVLIVVCDNTTIAEIMYQHLSGEVEVDALDDDGNETRAIEYQGSRILPEFSNAPGLRRTVRIDTKLLDKIETADGQSKDEAANELRAIIDTVGKRGQPGEQVRCVVSVSMLTEGWDANNVTHILGVRAFDSQLLCEQVVGRGLRRMSYDATPDDRFEAEYVDVYGIPFSLIPFKGKPKEAEKTDKPQHRIYAMDERREFAIRMPVVESYTYDVRRSGIEPDFDKMAGMTVADEPTRVYLRMVRAYETEGEAITEAAFEEQDRAAFYERTRLQTVIFEVARLIVEDIVSGARGPNADELKKSTLAKHQLFPEVVAIVRRYVREKVKFAKGVDPRELALKKYVDLLRERVLAGILPAASSLDAPLVPIINSYEPWATTDDVDYSTTRPVYRLTKSHLNAAVVLSKGGDGAIGEQAAIDILEDMVSVVCFAPNGRSIGFTVPYEYKDVPRRYEPDFVVRMQGGTHVLLEIKGAKGIVHGEDLVDAKKAGAQKWVDAVNNTKRYGTWAYELCTELASLRGQLEKHTDAGQLAAVLPFRFVPENERRHYGNCVPRVSLRAAAGAWSDEQINLEGSPTHAEEWVAWDDHPRFERGMFVAKVEGRSMEPEIPSGSYCLFRPLEGRSPEGRTVLVRSSGINDPETGGQFTVKVWRSETVPADEVGYRHTRITLTPRNPEFAPIVLTPGDEGSVTPLGEVVLTLHSTPNTHA